MVSSRFQQKNGFVSFVFFFCLPVRFEFYSANKTESAGNLQEKAVVNAHARWMLAGLRVRTVDHKGLRNGGGYIDREKREETACEKAKRVLDLRPPRYSGRSKQKSLQS